MKINLTLDLDDDEVKKLIGQVQGLADPAPEAKPWYTEEKLHPQGPGAEIIRRMRERGVESAWLARKIGIAPSTMSRRLHGGGEFTTSEMYAILDALGVPHTKILAYFPPKAAKKEVRKLA